MIPNYHLYGEERRSGFPDILHCESIAARSSGHNWVISPHRHHALHQFFWIEAGGGAMTIDGQKYDLKSNHVISIPTNAVHGFEFIQNTKGYVITVPYQKLRAGLQTLPEFSTQIEKPLLANADDTLSFYFKQISKEHKRSLQGRPEVLQHLTVLLALEIARNHKPHHTSHPDKLDKKQIQVQQFMENVEVSFRSEHKAKFYADKQHITLPHLTRVCRQVLGKPASEIIQERLLLEARRALVYTRISIGELAYDLGFNDPAHFSKFFRTGTGQSPSAYRVKAEGAKPVQPAERILQALQKAGKPKGN